MKKDKNKKVKLVVVGSVALDTIETPIEKKEEILGGSASFACAAASRFVKTGIIGIVGSDFPKKYLDLLESFNVDLKGLEKINGKTFRWSGTYDKDMNNRTTLCTALNVFADFKPKVPDEYKTAPYIFLANIEPRLQLMVLDQMKRKPKFVAADTMELWIKTTNSDLMNLIKKIDLLFINDSEARHITGNFSLLQAAKILLEIGPRFVVIKKGEHGSLLFSKNSIFIIPAFPTENVLDPTGAGDSFAGAFMGYIARAGRINTATMRKAMLFGTVAASYTVEKFSLDGLCDATLEKLKKRARILRNMIRV